MLYRSVNVRDWFCVKCLELCFGVFREGLPVSLLHVGVSSTCNCAGVDVCSCCDDDG